MFQKFINMVMQSELEDFFDMPSLALLPQVHLGHLLFYCSPNKKVSKKQGRPAFRLSH